MAALSPAAGTSEIKKVMIQPVYNRMMFFASEPDGNTEALATWGLYGDYFPWHVDQRDRDHWNTVPAVPTVIAYVNFKLDQYLYPEKTAEHHAFKEILAEQINHTGEIAPDLRRSLDIQIMATTPASWKFMRNEADLRKASRANNTIFTTKDAFLACHNSLKPNRVVF